MLTIIADALRVGRKAWPMLKLPLTLTCLVWSVILIGEQASQQRPVAVRLGLITSNAVHQSLGSDSTMGAAVDK